MPAYDYDCAACGRRFEVTHGVHVDPPTACPLCGGGPVRKAITAAAIHYKGSGWAKKERRAATSGASRSTGEGTAAPDETKTSETATSETATSEAAGRETRKPAPAKTAEAGATTTSD
jgi:putative FmdB family regulatory protein